jgi:hypothetical protein
MFVGLAVVLLTGQALACSIRFEPTDVKVDKDGEATVTVWVQWEHNRCVLDDDDINIDYTGLKELSNSGWTKVKHGLFKNELKVQLTAEKEGAIRAWRECSKKGTSEASVKVTR